ncbi:MAG: prenyltransferase/squalene oxidase repeat-containing protein, partial [Planctomycetota bacterium]
DGLCAIFPPLVYIQVAYHALGEPRDHWLRQQCEHEIERWIVDGTDTNPPHKRIAPCFSPVWDTGIALYAVTETGVTASSDERLAKTCDWLREREVMTVGDWVHNLRPADRTLTMGPGGTDAAWAFEYRNEWSPDVDDTAMICKSLWRAGDRPGENANRDAAKRGIRWILRMQNDDGGFAAFDRTKHRNWMEAIPFADHNAMQDPSCADITGRTLEALITCGVPQDHPAVKRAVRYLQHEQYDFGGWWGRWGVNFIYGTWQAVGGLVHAGEDPKQPYLQRTADWLRSIQQDDGGFGENANSYLSGEGGRKWIGVGKTTASQTAWAVMALMFLAGAEDPAVERAIHFLCNNQLKHPAPANFPEHPLEEPAGSWQESEFTGGGFPKVFYLRYHLYRHYFPQMALARYTNLVSDN